MASDERYADSAQAREWDKDEYLLPDGDPWAPIDHKAKAAKEQACLLSSQVKINALVGEIGAFFGYKK